MSQGFRLAVFVYDFPHRKVQDFLVRLHLDGYRVDAVIAQEWVKLNIPASTVRTKVKSGGLLHPRDIAGRLNMPYHVLPHNDEKVVELVTEQNTDLGVIAGARILKAPVIHAFKKGVINFHPGLIPEARGLDALLWSVYHDVPLGVTAHLIDERVDAGIILMKEQIPIYTNDTVFDLSERLHTTQLDLIKPAIEAAIEGQHISITMDRPYNRKMPPEQEQATLNKLPEYIQRHTLAE